MMKKDFCQDKVFLNIKIRLLNRKKNLNKNDKKEINRPYVKREKYRMVTTETDPNKWCWAQQSSSLLDNMLIYIQYNW